MDAIKDRILLLPPRRDSAKSIILWLGFNKEKRPLQRSRRHSDLQGTAHGSGTENMSPNGVDHRAGTNPFVGSRFRIVIINGAAGRIPSVKGVLSGPISTFCHRLIKLTVVQTGEGAVLINHAGDGVGKRGVFHPCLLYTSRCV